ncbi:thioesterase II family protein [Pseudoalteromonas sp. T1lg65]|uniref:thioesterase II family protein n=1 Tax=Pseudoalteromonas sp. T1lg65 TaxID=2077101 RepID=UPI003F790413
MTSKLFYTPKPNPNAKLRLFCFPYAGGSPTAFMPWNNLVHSDIELIVIQLPGRGARLAEEAHDNMEDIIAELLSYQSHFGGKPYAFFGHSLGSRVMYELTVQLLQQGKPLPIKLFASGSRAPHTSSTSKSIYDLPHDEFLDELKTLNGTPKEVLENKELMEFLIPLIRADFKVADTYRANIKTLPVPIHVFDGKQDKTTVEQIQAWQELTHHPIDVTEFEGGHFFINQHYPSMIEMINKQLVQKPEDVALMV